MNEQSLDTLVIAYRSGQSHAFDAIYEATNTKVYYTILTILKDPSLAEDLMQETYLKMIEFIPKYKPKNQFQAWLNTIAKNLALNTYNRRKKEQLVDVNDSEHLFGTSEDNAEDKYYLQSLLTVLNEDEKHVVIRHVILEEKHKDIAKALNKPLGTITWMYQNALKKLRKEAGEDHE